MLICLVLNRYSQRLRYLHRNIIVVVSTIILIPQMEVRMDKGDEVRFSIILDQTDLIFREISLLRHNLLLLIVVVVLSFVFFFFLFFYLFIYLF